MSVHLLGAIEEGAAGAVPSPQRSARCRNRLAKTAEPAKAETPLSPAVRKIVAENKVDAAAIAGTGKDGRLTKGDVIEHLAKPAVEARPAVEVKPVVVPPPATPAPQGEREERVRMSRLRQTIARRLKDAQNTAAMLTTFNEVDMSAVMALAQPLQGSVREEARRQARLHELLREGGDPGA